MEENDSIVPLEPTRIFIGNSCSSAGRPNRFRTMIILLLLLLPLITGMKISLYSRDKYVREYFALSFKDSDKVPDIMWGITMAMFPVGGGVGALSITYFSNRFGRKYTVTACVLIGLIGQTLAVLSYIFKTYWLLFISRFFDGLSAGSSMNVGICYFFELIPVSYSAACNPLIQVFVNLGILLSGIFSFDKIIDDVWIITSIPVMIAQVSILIVVFCLPESPFYIYEKTQNVNNVKPLIKCLRGKNYQYLEQEVSNLINQNSAEERQSAVGTIEFLTTKKLIPSIIVMSVIQASQQLSGVNAIIFYANDFIVSAGFPTEDLGVLVILGLCLFGSIVFTPCLSRFSSRTMILIGYFGMSACFFASFTAWISHAPSSVVVLFLGGFLFIFQAGPGPKPWVIIIETYPQKYKAAAQGFLTFLNWFSSAVVSIAYMWASKPLGFYVSLLFGFINLFTFLFLLVFMVDSTNKTSEEVTEEYRQKMPCC